ncbi:MAG: hypothetical protein WBQ44_01635 [Rhodococcus sp. (in: high G+C Gram-positive bacteria)]
MTLFQLLPSLTAACRPRFDSEEWPADTCYHLGRIVVDGCALEDLADCEGTPTSIDGVMVTRVRSVIAGVVTIDAPPGEYVDAAVANRHCTARLEFFGLGNSKVELPCDVRAGDVLALVAEAESAVSRHSRRESVGGVRGGDVA